jgi:signal transduction histidine kinase
MNTEIIRGNALQVLELAERVEALEREKTENLNTAQYYSDTKDRRINELEKEKEELNKRCERLNADSMAYHNYGKEIEKKKNNEIKELQKEKQRLTSDLSATQSDLLIYRMKVEEAWQFVESEKKKLAEILQSEKKKHKDEIECVEQQVMKIGKLAHEYNAISDDVFKNLTLYKNENNRLKAILARNGIKYKKVKNA